MSYKRSSGAVGWTVFAIILAALVVFFAFVTDGFRNWDAKTWFKPQEEQPETPPAVDGDGKDLTSGEVHEMPRAMVFRMAEALSADASQPSSVTLTATVKPAYADNKTVSWSVAFVNPSATWASGKKATDYVTVTPESDGSATATVSCKKDFGAQIKVVVQSRDNADAKAECTVDFAKRIKSVSRTLTSLDKTANYTLGSGQSMVDVNYLKSSGSFTGSDTFVYTDYTVEDTFAVSITQDLESLFKQSFVDLANTDYGLSNVNFPSGSKSVSDFSAFACPTAILMNYYFPASSNPSLTAAQIDTLALKVLKTSETVERVFIKYSFTYTGKYSTFTYNNVIRFNAASLIAGVTDIELDNTVIIF